MTGPWRMIHARAAVSVTQSPRGGLHPSRRPRHRRVLPGALPAGLADAAPPDPRGSGPRPGLPLRPRRGRRRGRRRLLARTLKSVSQLPVSDACDTLLAVLAPRPPTTSPSSWPEPDPGPAETSGTQAHRSTSPALGPVMEPAAVHVPLSRSMMLNGVWAHARSAPLWVAGGSRSRMPLSTWPAHSPRDLGELQHGPLKGRGRTLATAQRP
jgi:hypothetical protein